MTTIMKRPANKIIDWDRENINKLVELIKSGNKTIDIAKSFKVSRASIDRAISLHTVGVREIRKGL